MSEPTTEAGKRLLAELAEIREDYYPFADYPDADRIAAIEAEASAPLEAEIARLRRIEEAARALCDDVMGIVCDVCLTDHGHFPGCPAVALRAALEDR